MTQQQTYTRPYIYNLLQIFSKVLSDDIVVLYFFPGWGALLISPSCSLAVE